MTERVDITVRDNKTEILSFVHQDAMGDTIDWTGHTAAVQVRSNDDPEADNPDSNVVLQLTSDSNEIVVDEDGVHITIQPGQYPEPGSYRYDLRLYMNNIFVVPQGGKFRVIEGVTTYE